LPDLMPSGARAAGRVALVASLAFAALAAWEIGAPLEGGHWASMAGCAIAAENMLRHHIFAAVAHYPASPPPDHAQYYCRHPYAIYVMEAIARAVFGHRSWALRVPAVVCSAVTPFVLFRLGKALWGPVAAAVATVTFAVVPVDLAFAMFSSLEVPTILFGLLFCLGTVRVWQGGGRRDVVLSALGALGACHSDWPGVMLVGIVAACGAARAYALPPAWRGPADAPLLRAWVLTVVAVVLGTLLLYVALILAAGQMSDVLYGAQMRSAGHGPPWEALQNPLRRMRLLWMIPSVGFAVILAALPIAAWRFRSKPGEVLLLAWTFTASFQYLYFRQGADIHIFWPQYYGPCVALALGTLTDALLGWKLLTKRAWLRSVSLAFTVAIPIALFARVGLTVLDQSRLTQGRFDEHELYIESGAAQSQFAAWATRGAPRDALLPCTKLCSWNVEYATGLPLVEGPIDLSPRGALDRDRVELVDARYAPSAALLQLARTYDTVAVGSFLRVDRALPGSGVRAVRFEEREPTLLERLFVTDHDLIRVIGADADPWATSQWADAFGTYAPVPHVEPESLDELVAAYDASSVAGDASRAGALRARALARLGSMLGVDLTRDVHLTGSSVEYGPAVRVTLLWETGARFEPPREDSTFVVRCRTVEDPSLWPVPVDRLERETAPPMTIKPALWRADHLYVQRFVLLPRPGIEVCRGYFTPGDPAPVSGRFDVPLFTIR
jgi:4-amino-4-deoxy-L-arabinose transferase-like glycosyltransferase